MTNTCMQGWYTSLRLQVGTCTRGLYTPYGSDRDFNPHYGWDMHMRLIHLITTSSWDIPARFGHPITDLIRILILITTWTCTRDLYTWLWLWSRFYSLLPLRHACEFCFPHYGFKSRHAHVVYIPHFENSIMKFSTSTYHTLIKRYHLVTLFLKLTVLKKFVISYVLVKYNFLLAR